MEHVRFDQQRVCKSTYAAELPSALDLTGLAPAILGTPTERLLDVWTPMELLEIHNFGSVRRSMRAVCERMSRGR